MSEEQNNKPRVRKRYLYLDKFVSYTEIMEQRVTKLEKLGTVKTIALIGLSLALALVALFK